MKQARLSVYAMVSGKVMERRLMRVRIKKFIQEAIPFLFILVFVVGCSVTPNVVIRGDRLRSVRRVAVLDLTDAPGADAGHSGKVVSGALASNALRISNWNIIEREKIKQILDEQQFQLSEVVDSETAINLGRILGVDTIIAGSVSQYRIGSIPFIFFFSLDQDVYKVAFNFRLIDVETADILVTGSVSEESFVSLEDAANEASMKIFDLINDSMSASAQTNEENTYVTARVENSVTTGKPQNPNMLKLNIQDRFTSEIDNKKRSFGTASSAIFRQWAIVVGVSEYDNSGQNGLSNLAYADDDAKAFADSLERQGWSSSHIKTLTNDQATQRNVMIALESWLTKAGPDDMVVLFWSGHGFPDPEDPEKVYFACYDTDPRIPATGYRMDRVRSAVEELGVRNVVMLADTCHAGKLITRGDEKAIGISPYVDSLARKQDVPKGWIFMVASDVDRKAIEDSSWSHGAFTHCLLKALNGEADGYQSAGAIDGTVTMGELRAYMNTAMPDETQKVLGVAKRPMITTSTGDPDIWNLSLSSK